MNSKIKNIAIIAHVDHGKTTLIDSLLKQSGEVKEYQEMNVRAMDSNDIERERGITILAKCTSIHWDGYKINIVDTPGHADFGGEVERILSMVDGAIILVDAAEGPLPQTKFVLTKALALNLKPIVVINKVDRADARVSEVLDEIYELFLTLNATDEQLNFKVLYASGRNGWSTTDLNNPTNNLNSLFETVLEEIPDSKSNIEEPFKMLNVILEVDPFLGVLLTGKVESGVLKPNMSVKVLDLNGNLVENGRITKVLTFEGLNRVAVDEVKAGDIAILAGLKKATVTHTVCDPVISEPIKSTPVDPPTMSINLYVNDSPFAGQDGKKCTSRMIGDRLEKEAEKNIALKVKNKGEYFEVSGRGELHLGILIETMRREGFEMGISKPNVILKRSESNKILEPFEEVLVDCDDPYSGVVIEKMTKRKAAMQEMFQTGMGKTRIIFKAPTRGLIGYHSEFLTDTRGTGIMNRSFLCYDDYAGELPGRTNGVLISNDVGQSTAYSLFNLEDRGEMLISPGEQVYRGMIVGEHSKENDLEVNVVKGKALTNMRASGKDDAVKCKPCRLLTIESAITYIESDELLEITPNHIRLRKKYLDPNERKKHSRQNNDMVFG
ncbi:translational GTPase TypA [Alphaproteobacteria bacterium endosymbiont of Tiliacea citrago]|uniref:translational GTPase TypA n=1 Tax=Alphaproteobacteria bacterium endosymbiont of Tiliacea citrago TaxID=3077944 RepID=UPI00313AEC02